MKKEVDKRPLGIYIHIPFCVKKCLYCDFLSFAGKEAQMDDYVDALCKELKGRSQEVKITHVVKSIFFGGGTPSLLATSHVDAIMSTILGEYVIDNDCEISMEVNPGTISEGNLEGLRNAGINRISIGLQSGNDEELKRLGRIHTYEEFLATYGEARRVGFANINVDLMSALPGQTMQSWVNTLEKIVALGPEHISAYSLIIEEETPFFDIYGGQKEVRSHYPLPDEEEERQMYMLTKELLNRHGYHRYEISNYAKQSFECRHNSSYWIRNDYLGFGIGAASLLHSVRWKNMDDIDNYINTYLNSEIDTQIDTQIDTHREATANEESLEGTERTELSEKDQMEEFMYLGLRLCKGVSCQDFDEHFQKDMRAVYGPIIDGFVSDGLLETWENGSETGIRLTEKGIDVSNYVLAEFLLED